MAPRTQRIVIQPATPAKPRSRDGFARSIYNEVTSPENASVIRSIAIFGVAVAFFSSSWSEFLLPPT